MDRSLGDAAALAARCGADGLELTGRPPHLAPEASLDELRAAGDCVRSQGLDLTAYGSYLSYGGLEYAADAAREAQRGAALGTKLLRVWAGHPSGTHDDVREEVVLLLRTVGDAAAAEGIHVVVERHGGTLADTAARSEALLDAVDHDNVSLNYQPLDGLLPAEVARQPDDARRLVPRSSYFHVKNYRPSPEAGGPLLLGGDLEAGVLDYPAILAAAVGAGYRGPYGIEFVAFDDRSLEAKVAAGVAWLRRTLGAAGAP